MLLSEVSESITLGVLGDAGLTRADEFFGDNHSFNQTLFDKVRTFILSHR